ncbi:hypothetical protein BGW80DRAFT_1459492 [Lactifluus volemus]|nr:hypothetical protein BGW80DRAFT_1459492 [Lactifluus volemus]
MGSYSQSLPTSSNSTWMSNEASITPPQNELGDSGTICKLTTALSEAVQTERIDSLRPLLGKWDQAVAQYRKTTENTIRELEERERTFFLTYATSNIAPFPMTQGGAIQDVDDTMARFAANASAELSPAPNPASDSDAQETELEPEYTVTLELETGGSYRTRVRVEAPVRDRLIRTWSNDLTIKPAWKAMPSQEFGECMNLKKHKPTVVRLKPVFDAKQAERVNFVKLFEWLRDHKLYASGSWGIPADTQPKENVIIAPFTGAAAPHDLPLTPATYAAPTYAIEASQDQQGAHIPEQPLTPPAQQHEQFFPLARHPVLEPHQYASIGHYSNSWTNTGGAQPNHVIPSMPQYAAAEGSDPNRPGPSASYLGGPNASMTAGYWDAGMYPEAAYRDSYYGQR